MDYEDKIFRDAENDTVGVTNLTDISNKYVVEDSILAVFGLIGIAANILLIYIICYYRKLHTTTNTYIIHWAIADTGSAIITLTCLRVFYNILDISLEILCFYIGIGFALILNDMLFMIMLTIDWCLSSYFPRLLDKFRKCTRIIIAVLWVVAALYSVASSLICTSYAELYLIFHVTLPLTYAILIVLVVALHCYRIVQKLRKKVEYHLVSMLLIPTAYMLCGLLSWANLLFLDIPYMLSETPVFLHPTLNLVLLIILNEDFKTCFFQVMKCKLPTCNFFKFKSSPRNIEENTNSNNVERGLSFDNKMFDQGNRHI